MEKAQWIWHKKMAKVNELAHKGAPLNIVE